MTRNRQNLAQIAKAIKVVEKKRLIGGIVQIGRLLHMASEQCEHGEYMAWIEAEFGWSHQTTLNYRNVYDLTQNPNRLDFEKLNITQSALYLIASMKDVNEQPARKAIIKAAKRGRVTRRIAYDIIDQINIPPEPLIPPPELPPIEPLDDETAEPPPVDLDESPPIMVRPFKCEPVSVWGLEFCRARRSQARDQFASRYVG